MSKLTILQKRVKPVSLGVDNPEGVITANEGTLAYGTDGSLWLKAMGSGDTGWTQITAEMTLDGGEF